LRFERERKGRKDTELSFGAPKENVSRFIVVPYALKRSVHLDSVRSDIPNNTQCPAQTFSYLVLSRRTDPSFPHFSLVPQDRMSFGTTKIYRPQKYSSIGE